MRIQDIQHFISDRKTWWPECKAELIEINKLAVPFLMMNICYYGLFITDTMFLGHIGKDELGSAQLANAWMWGTGYLSIGVIFGMDTLASQAYGAKNYYLVGIIFQNCLVVVTITFVIVSILWWTTEEFMLLFGETASSAQLAGIFAKYSIPGLLPFLFYRAGLRWLSNQGIAKPATIVTSITLFIVLNWLFVVVFKLGLSGAATANSLCRVFMCVFLFSYVYKMGYHQLTWPGWSWEAVNPKKLSVFLKFGIPSCLMMVLEVCGFEILSILVGKLHSAPMLAAHSILYSVNTFGYIMPLSLSFGVSTRVGNHMGAGSWKTARISALSGVAFGCVLLVASLLTFTIVRNWFGYMYTNDEDVLKYVKVLVPLAASVSFCDGFQTICGAILRGVGLPNQATVINLVGYYVVSIPLSCLFAFVLGWELGGLWGGFLIGIFLIGAAFFGCIWFVDWRKESLKAQERSEDNPVVKVEDSLPSNGYHKLETDPEEDLELQDVPVELTE